MNGILNLNKPGGITSAAAVNKVKRILNEKTVGHMGTLDPQGTGVLLIGVGKAARLFDFFLKKDKIYRAEFTFGYTTDTLDGDGTVTDRTDVLPSESDIVQKIKLLTGEVDQIPPQYSAKSVNGKRAYDVARGGGFTDLAPSRVNIYDISLINKSGANSYIFEISCSSGTYIRSICRDLAALLGSLATMTMICRIKCGEFLVSDSVTLDELAVKKENALIPVDSVLDSIPRVDMPEYKFRLMQNGVKVYTDFEIEKPSAIYCNNELFGIGKTENGKLIISTNLYEVKDSK